jgi:hypothetical protein
MFSSGVATIFVTDMDRSVHFYTECLVLALLSASVITGLRWRPAA